MTNPYVPLLFLLAIGGGRGLLGVRCLDRRAQALQPRQAGRLRVRHRADPSGGGGGRVPIKYYLTAMLFIIFDIESVFLYPFAVAFNKLGLFALVEMVLFIITVFVAYAYVWRRGGLGGTWAPRREHKDR